MKDKLKPWEKYRREMEGKNKVAPADESALPEGREQKAGDDRGGSDNKERVNGTPAPAPRPRGSGEFYRDLEDYLEKEYERVLAPMKETLSRKQINILSPDRSGPGVSPPTRPGRKSPNEGDGTQSSGIKVRHNNDIETPSLRHENEAEDPSLKHENDKRRENTSSSCITSDGNLSSSCLTPPTSTSSSCLTLQPDTSSSRLTPRLWGGENVSGEERAITVLGEGRVDRIRLGIALREERRNAPLAPSTEQVIWKLADRADKTGSRKVSAPMNALCRELGFSPATARRVPGRLRKHKTIFESVKTFRNKGTSAVFQSLFWSGDAPDREIDKNHKSIFSILRPELKEDEVFFLEFLFSIHFSGAFVDSSSFSRERERFFRRLLKDKRAEILEREPTIGGRRLLEETYREGAVAVVSTWRFIRSQTSREIVRPLAYLISCLNRGDGEGGSFADRMTLSDLNEGRAVTELLEYVLNDSLDLPDMDTLLRIGEMVGVSQGDRVSRTLLSSAIRKEAAATAMGIFEAWEFVRGMR